MAFALLGAGTAAYMAMRSMGIGPAGTGKTRLAIELIEDLGTEEWDAGFVTGDATTIALRAFLRVLGHRPIGWGLGINAGFADHIAAGLDRAVLDLSHKHGSTIDIIGQTLPKTLLLVAAGMTLAAAADTLQPGRNGPSCGGHHDDRHRRDDRPGAIVEA